jgi:periplasmic divalent cation tolerance protein
MNGETLMIMTTTFPDRPAAEKAARLLVDAGLAVCAQVGADLTSFYRGEGQVKPDQEVAVVFKVLGDRFDLFCGELNLQHPYEVPQMVAWPATYVAKAYAQWAAGKGK